MIKAGPGLDSNLYRICQRGLPFNILNVASIIIMMIMMAHDGPGLGVGIVKLAK